MLKPGSRLIGKTALNAFNEFYVIDCIGGPYY